MSRSGTHTYMHAASKGYNLQCMREEQVDGGWRLLAEAAAAAAAAADDDDRGN